MAPSDPLPESGGSAEFNENGGNHGGPPPGSEDHGGDRHGGDHTASLHAAGGNGGGADGAHTNGASTNGAATNGVLATIDNHLSGVPAVGWSYGPPARPEILKARPNPIELLHAVRRRWPLAVGLGVTVGTIAAALVWFFVPVRYEAFALLKISEKPPSVLGKSPNATEEFAIFKRTQVQMIRSNMVLLGTLRDTLVMRLATMQEHNDDPVSWLNGQLIIDYPDDAEVLRIAMKGKHADDVKKIVNKIIDVYMKEVIERDRDRRLEHEAKLDRSHNTMTGEIGKQMEALRTLEALHKTSGSESAKLKKDMAVEELNNKMHHLSLINKEIKENAMALFLAQARRDNPEETRPPDVLIEMQMEQDPIIMNASSELMYLNEHLTRLRGKPNFQASPTYRKVMSEILLREERIEERKAFLRPRYSEVLASGGVNNPNTSQNRSDNLTLGLLEKQKTYLEGEVKKADEAINKQLEHVESLESYSAAVAQKADDLRAWQKISNELRGELDRVRIEKLAPERVQKIDDASLASGSGDSVRKYVAVVFSGILGFGLVIVSIAFLEFQSRKLNSVAEMNDGLGIRVVGELPKLTGRTWKKIKGGKGPSVLKALMAERIDGTRTALIHANSVAPPRVVMLTSAEPREGKTTTASQLAASLARSGRRTLLVDADIRNPGAHRVFEMPQDPGLCELLRGEVERDAVIHPTRTANLWLLPAGRCDLRSVQALSTSYLGTAIAALGVQFDYVVIDSGPVLKIADPLLIGQHVDAAIVSVLRDVSKVPKVYEACERLRSVGITVLGSVVNGVNDDAARHGVELLLAETPQAAKPEATTA